MHSRQGGTVRSESCAVSDWLVELSSRDQIDAALISAGPDSLRVHKNRGVSCIAFHEKAFKLKMKFIHLGGLRFGIELPCGLGVVVQI
jgi:hypothetical protein